jgi:hypothetical protein
VLNVDFIEPILLIIGIVIFEILSQLISLGVVVRRRNARYGLRKLRYY